MALRSIRNGLQALADLGTAIEQALFGRRRRDAHNAQQMRQDDIEMDIITALNAGPNLDHFNNPGRAQPISSVREIFNRLRMTRLCRSIMLHVARDVTLTAVILAIIGFFMLIGFLLQYPLGWLLEPVGLTSRNLAIDNWQKLDNFSSTWSAQDNQSAAIVNTDPFYVPGLYILLPHDDSFDSVWQTSPAASASPTSESVNDVTTTATTQDLIAVDKHMMKRHSRDTYGPFHHAYPIHAGRVHHSEHAKEIKDQLLYCANVLIKRLEGQGLDITSSFEFMLQHCKSIIDHALDTLYPSTAEISTISTGIKKRSAEVSPVATVSTDRIHTRADKVSSECEWKRPISRLTGRSCSKDFCDWVSIANLDRCYHLNKTQFQQDGTKSFLNESIDDFKDDAPLECNLCLPRRDCDGIDEHCANLETTQSKVFYNVIIVASVLLFVTGFTAMFATLYYRRRERLAAGVPQGVESFALTPVPTAQA